MSAVSSRAEGEALVLVPWEVEEEVAQLHSLEEVVEDQSHG